MKRGMILYVAVNVIVAALIGAAVSAMPEKQKQLGSLLFLLLLPLPLIMAYVAHRASGATGNPFRGLVWGNTSWYFLVWFLALLAGLVTAGVCIGLGMAHIDPSMADYKAMVAQQAIKNGAPESAASATAGTAAVIGWATVFAGPTIGSFFGAALACLSMFPWLGWFFRRLMVGGTAQAMLILAVILGLISSVGGLAANPSFGELSIPVRMLLAGLSSALAIPALVWVLLRTRSVVLATLASISFTTAVASLAPILSDSNPVFLSQFGLAPSAVALLIGIALWVWKNPGGDDLAVAAVAADGTPLTPAQFAYLQAAGNAAPASAPVQAG